jgi:hypothetical protein
MRAAAFAGLLLATAPVFAHAGEAPRIPVRVGDHPGHGRIVFDWPAVVGYEIRDSDGVVRLSFAAAGVPDLSRIARPPRNVAAIAASDGGVEIRLQPGARLRHFRLGTRIVLDIADPAAAEDGGAAAAAARPAPLAGSASPASSPSSPRAAAVRPAGPAPGGVAPAPAPPPPAAAAASPPPPAAPVAAPAVAASSASPATAAAVGEAAVASPPAAAPVASPVPMVLPVPQAVPVRLHAPPGSPRALALALPEETAAAAFRRGDWLYAVFDVERPLDLSALRGDPLFGHAEALPLPGATVLRLPIAAPAVLALRRHGAEWRIEPQRQAPPTRSLTLELEAGPPVRLALRAASPGRIVPLTDPETGLPLLVATVGEAGQAMPLARRLPQAEMLPTTLGAAVLVRDDRLRLSRGTDRFRLSVEGSPEGLRVGAAGVGPLADAAAMTRLFDLPNASAAELLARAREQQAALAAAPPLQRAPLRRALAQTLLALGLPQEGQAVLALAVQEDPRAAADPAVTALAAAAAALADRPEEAAALTDPRLPPSDELTLWQAVLAARRGDPAAAAGFAATLPLLLAYPEGLRARLLPIAALALAEAGEEAALATILAAAPAAPAFELARARLAEARGRTAEALAGYEAVAAGRDRRARAIALRRGIELRLSAGLLDAAGAARALEATLFAWRGEAEEVATRLRLAELQRQAGANRAAFELLRETEALFPAEAPRLRAAAAEALLAALAQEPPLAAVALQEAHRGLLADHARQAEAALLLAERLLALDLPQRAEAVLREALPAAAGEARGRLGLRLAEVRLAEGDAAGALAALGESDSPGLDPALRERRALVGAEALARRGERAAAILALAALGPAGHAARARLLAEDGRWAEAAEALAAHLAAVAPEGPLPEELAREAVRLAAYAVLAGDESRLAGLRTTLAPRLPPGRLAEAFAALLADPVRGVADLPRLARELEFLRDLPRLLEPLRAEARSAR